MQLGLIGWLRPPPVAEYSILPYLLPLLHLPSTSMLIRNYTKSVVVMLEDLKHRRKNKSIRSAISDINNYFSFMIRSDKVTAFQLEDFDPRFPPGL